MEKVFKNWISILETSPRDFISCFKNISLGGNKGIFVKDSTKVVVYWNNKVEVFKGADKIIEHYNIIQASSFLTSFNHFGVDTMKMIKEEKEEERLREELEEQEKIKKELLLS